MPPTPAPTRAPAVRERVRQPSQPRHAASRTRRPKRRIDATVLLSWYVAILLIIPNRLVLNGLSFNLTPSLLLGLGLGMWWFCAQLTSTLGAAKGRNAVRTGLFLFLA